MSTTHDSSAPTLTNVTRIGRQVVNVGVIGIVLLIVGRMALTTFIKYWKATHPEPPPPPTVGFGVLPAIEFPEQEVDAKPASYRLEIPTGKFQDFGDRAKVFLMPKSSPSLLADQEAKKIAQKYNFVFQPEVIDERTYRWTRSQPLESTFELDVQNHNFTLQTDYLSRAELIINKKLPDEFEAVDMVKKYLKFSNLLPADVASSSGEVKFLKSLGPELVEALSLSDADFIQVDLNRYPIDSQFNMYTPGGYRGSISAIIAGVLKQNDAIVWIEYNYQLVDYTEVETYPLRPVQEAWKLLQAGEGFTVSEKEIDEAVIRDVYLGYFDSFIEQDYLQPIYVFEGDNRFLGYVPAITGQYITKTVE